MARANSWGARKILPSDRATDDMTVPIAVRVSTNATHVADI